MKTNITVILGAPGTGKTELAREIAGSAHVFIDEKQLNDPFVFGLLGLSELDKETIIIDDVKNLNSILMLKSIDVINISQKGKPSRNIDVPPLIFTSSTITREELNIFKNINIITIAK